MTSKMVDVRLVSFMVALIVSDRGASDLATQRCREYTCCNDFAELATASSISDDSYGGHQIVAELRKRTLDEVQALSQEEAVEIMRQAGIVGAGGGGFPTYFKYKKPQPMIIVNAAESEPGYWGDKLVHKEHLEEFLLLFEAMKAIFGFEQISMGVHNKDREWFAEYQEHAGDGIYDMRYVPDTYALGEEKTLIKHSTDTKVPLFLDTPAGKRRPGMPPDVGIVVNNSETLLNVYNALFLGKPTTTTFFTVYGEEIDLKVYEAPIGASFAEILGI